MAIALRSQMAAWIGGTVRTSSRGTMKMIEQRTLSAVLQVIVPPSTKIIASRRHGRSSSTFRIFEQKAVKKGSKKKGGHTLADFFEKTAGPFYNKTLQGDSAEFNTLVQKHQQSVDHNAKATTDGQQLLAVGKHATSSSSSSTIGPSDASKKAVDALKARMDERRTKKLVSAKKSDPPLPQPIASAK